MIKKIFSKGLDVILFPIVMVVCIICDVIIKVLKFIFDAVAKRLYK